MQKQRLAKKFQSNLMGSAVTRITTAMGDVAILETI